MHPFITERETFVRFTLLLNVLTAAFQRTYLKFLPSTENKQRQTKWAIYVLDTVTSSCRFFVSKTMTILRKYQRCKK